MLWWNPWPDELPRTRLPLWLLLVVWCATVLVALGGGYDPATHTAPVYPRRLLGRCRHDGTQTLGGAMTGFDLMLLVGVALGAAGMLVVMILVGRMW
jgi:hypothetical protein